MTFRFFKTLAFRLTLLYGGVFTLSSCLAFLLFYYLISQTILERMDRDLLDKAGAFSAIYSVQGINGMRDLAVLESRAAGEKKVFFRLLYATGEVFASSHMSYWGKIGVETGALNRLIRDGSPVFKTVELHPSAPEVRVLYAFSGAGVILQTGISMESYAHFFMTFKRVFAGAMAIVVFISALSGWFVSKRALSGVGRITDTAGRISGASLDARVPETGNRDELDHLAGTFNRMLDRIEHLVTSIREMSDNIAHDLKSPITRIRGLSEITLLDPETDRADFQTMAASTIEEADRLLDMINTMLVISRTDAGEDGFVFETVGISDLVLEACSLFSPVAEEKGIELVCRAEDNLSAVADKGMIQRAMANILDNAVKYTQKGGGVNVWVTAEDPRVIEIRVADSGKGVAAHDIERIFERFYRVDPSRSETGTGLGLSFARAVVRAHGGEVDVTSRPGEGSTFILRLPIGNPGVI